MRYIHSEETIEVPENVKISIKSRLVTVEGPRGKLTKDLGHIAVSFSVIKKGIVGLEMHHGNRKNVAALRTVRTLINNMIIGVTKGFKYKMRYVYAHFPINVNLDVNSETGNHEVEIRNFIGEKLVRRVVMQPGVEVEASKAQKDELILQGNSLEAVSQSAADIQQICRVRNKDIRKVRKGPGHCGSTSTALQYSGEDEVSGANSVYSSWTVSTFPRRATLLRSKQNDHGFLCALWGYTGVARGHGHLHISCSVKTTLLQNGQPPSQPNGFCGVHTNITSSRSTSDFFSS
ncbi:ribosomal protein L6, alpha-beta domain-containing protein [Apiosordaria backusii]|uniref:Ribosomal protein L6, alpha-beta domain-containing protein n=1 Tax=Apiosordaria backusii TaxID=314023 RepID=A0AA40BP36_9PEZI|nr:ribosomal protein L6, alpha-beta domain-containing protein [Apiosordaria backusii]